MLWTICARMEHLESFRRSKTTSTRSELSKTLHSRKMVSIADKESETNLESFANCLVTLRCCRMSESSPVRPVKSYRVRPKEALQ